MNMPLARSIPTIAAERMARPFSSARLASKSPKAADPLSGPMLVEAEAANPAAPGLASSVRRSLLASGLERLDVQRACQVHDLRNMLAVALSGTNILRSPLASAGRAHVIDAVQHALERIEQLVAAVVGLRSSDATRRRWIDVGALLAHQGTVYRCFLPEAVHLRIETHSRLPLVWLDQVAFETALHNLVRNAMEAMPMGGCLTIRAKSLTGRLRLIVADTGTGMDAATLRRAALPFFTRKRGTGTGLGLAQVHRFAEETQAGLAVRSRVGRGSVFVMDFPVGEACG